MYNNYHMKKIYFYFCLLIGATLTLTSCLGDDSTWEEYENWRIANEEFFTQMKDSIDTATGQPYYQEIASESYPAYSLLYHVITEGDADGKVPYYTSTVRVNYSGHLYNTTTAFDSGTNVDFKVNEVISGWTWALQNMTVGSKWEVVIPWQLGYGSTGSTSIPSYSTLVFTIELVSIPKWEIGENDDDDDD